MQLSVIIVSYNVKYYLEQCLHSVLCACKDLHAEIIVIDNASEDNSIDYLHAKFPLVHFIKNETNDGFAKANNKALNHAQGKYILYLNPDTIIPEDVLMNCISFLNERQKAGATGIKMIDGSGNFLSESKRAFPSVMASFFKLSGIAALFPHSSVFNKYALGDLDEDKVHEVNVLSGAFLLSRREMLLSLKGFDEDFFMYGEDIDLSYRIQQSGYNNYYLGNNVIVHFKGESTKKDKAYVKNFYRAMEIFVHKHYKRTASIFLRSAIKAGAIFSLPGKKVQQVFRPAGKKSNNSFILLGDEEAVNTAGAILSANNYQYRTVSDSSEWSMINGSRLNLVFCLNKITYARCIQFVQNNKGKFVYYWHYKGSGSIISGSHASAIPQIYITI